MHGPAVELAIFRSLVRRPKPKHYIPSQPNSFFHKFLRQSPSSWYCRPQQGQNKQIWMKITISGKNVDDPGILVSSKVSLCGYSRGFAGEGGRWKLRFSLILFCLPNILRTSPHDSFHVMRLSMTLAIIYFKECYWIGCQSTGHSQLVTTSWLWQSQLQFSYNHNSKNLIV